MKKAHTIFSASLTGSASWLLATSALAGSFNIPSGTLATALEAYSVQSGVQIAISSEVLQGTRTKGAVGEMSPEQALSRILSGTGLTTRRVGSSIAVVKAPQEQSENIVSDSANLRLAQATSPRASVETVTVTSSKLGGADVQSIPIAITALSQEQLTATQTAGGPDLVKQVPNLTFTKTNFTGYSIQIRGIGTQAISVTTDPAVAVALNDIPFIRNHFFEQEFYDLSQAEVLRGPQGTLYGRNATAGVINLITAKPSDQFEAMASAEIGSYHQRRFEGMINLPLVDDRLDIRLAGEWTKRQGYSFNEITNQRIDGRDLWSGRLSVAFKPVENLQATLIWEHFSESDDRIRSSKQLCKSDPGPSEINGVLTNIDPNHIRDPLQFQDYLSQGCVQASLYSPESFQVPNPNALPYAVAVAFTGALKDHMNPYGNTVQSPNLRVIDSTIDPIYKATNDIAELNVDYTITPVLTFVSQTAFNHDFLYSTEDFNRFNTVPGLFDTNAGAEGDPHWFVTTGLLTPGGDFCDPQLGCSSRLVGQDRSDEHSWQLNQEFRLSSSFSGPFNFSAGGNFLHYETVENYYVFFNSLTFWTAGGRGSAKNEPTAANPYVGGISDDSFCLKSGLFYPDPFAPHSALYTCSYIDPNPMTNLNGNGHNYFRSENPYTLNSYAAFGEAYYNIFSDLKLTAGLRWTEDQKHFTDIPSELLVEDWGYPSIGTVNQQWDQFTGRAAVNWTPKLDFTDQTLIYGTYSHGYKAGGANPPGALLLSYQKQDIINPIHPLTFKPEFVDAFELGSKNTLLDGALTLNADAFYYNYEGYQISEIVDRTSINLNFDAHIKGGELEATWEPVPGLRLNFAGGYEDTALAQGSHAVDLIDRTAGRSDWMVLKPFVTQASNCIVPTYVVASEILASGFNISGTCGYAYNAHVDPVTAEQYTAFPGFASNGTPLPNYPGFDPLAGTPGDPYTGQNTYNGHDYGPAPNNGAGFFKDLSGNELPNAPHFTVSAGAQYSLPITSDWAGTLRADFYWQDNSWARVFNDNPYDRLHGYTNLNLTLIFTSQNGWQVMLYDKNVFNTTAITGDFLNSDDTGLTTNVFLTDPKLIGIRVTKNW